MDNANTRTLRKGERKQTGSAVEAPRKRVTIHDLASQLGVSSTTVWRALNDKSRIDSKTKTRILETAESLGYRPSMVAQTLRTQKTGVVGVVVPMVGDTTFSLIVRAIEQVAFEKGYNIILCNTDIDVNRERQYLDLLVRRRVEGVVVVPLAKRLPGEFDHLSDLEPHGIPVVSVEQSIPHLPFDQVSVDNYEGAKMVTRHLVDLGHQRIAFFHAGLAAWDYAQCSRFEGYKDALQEASLAYDPALTLQAGEMTIDERQPLNHGVIKGLLEKPERPTAIFAYCDGVAIKAMRIIRELGLRVPDDIAVVGCDDNVFSADLDVSLTTIRQPIEKMGRRAAEIIFQRIENKRSHREPPLCEKFACELIVRESSGGRLCAGSREEMRVF